MIILLLNSDNRQCALGPSLLLCQEGIPKWLTKGYTVLETGN